jgi:hypothetical protein
MNDYDRSNLNFIRSLNEEQFDEWYASISLDDVDYALELLKEARLELTVQMHEVTDNVKDTKLAKTALKKFML